MCLIDWPASLSLIKNRQHFGVVKPHILTVLRYTKDIQHQYILVQLDDIQNEVFGDWMLISTLLSSLYITGSLFFRLKKWTVLFTYTFAHCNQALNKY